MAIEVPTGAPFPAILWAPASRILYIKTCPQSGEDWPRPHWSVVKAFNENSRIQAHVSRNQPSLVVDSLEMMKHYKPYVLAQKERAPTSTVQLDDKREPDGRCNRSQVARCQPGLGDPGCDWTTTDWTMIHIPGCHD